MGDVSNTGKLLPAAKTSRRRFVSVAGGITAGLAFAARAFARDSQQPSPVEAATDNSRKDGNNSRRYDLKRGRAELSADANPPAIAYVEEVSATYIHDAGSIAPPDGWIVLASVAGGTYTLKGSALTLPIIGNESDDWPNFHAAAKACAASGVTLLFGPGVYTCNTGGLALPSNLHVACNPLTEISCNVRADGNATGSPFLVCPQQWNESQFAHDGLALDTSIGDQKVVLSGSIDLSPGDFIVLGVLFRTALYEVLAFDPASGTASLDRPLRLPFGSPTALASFPAGSAVNKVTPAKNVHIEFNGARINGDCVRFIEIFDGWKCRLDGPVYCGNGTSATAQERIISIDASCYDCHASGIYGDGGNTTSLGLSFESAEASTFSFCEMRNTRDAGITFQDAIDCVAIECKCCNNRGDGAVFTAAMTGGGSIFGADHCKIVGGSYSGNGRSGIIFERGSSRCVVDGAQVLSNGADGILENLGNDNLITGKTVVRRNSTGVRMKASARFTASSLQVTDQTNGIIVEADAHAVMLSGINANFNSTAVIIRGEADISQLTAIARVDTAAPQVSVESTGAARARGLVAAQGAPGTSSIEIAGIFDLESGHVIQQVGGTGINVKSSGVARVDTMVAVSGQGNAGIGIGVVDTGMLSIEGNPRIDPSSIFVAKTAKANFGKVVVGPDGKIDVDWPLLLPSDWIDVSPITGTGDYSVTNKPATGFTITGTPGDQLSWKVA